MPSSTFFRLPPEKREKLLDAACGEFARTPYPEASINQIVRRAGIPRGSFYMYFKDKEDLFTYLLGEFGDRIVSLLEQRLADHGGDLFPALLALYDQIQADYRDPAKNQIYMSVIAILRVNRDLIHTLFLCKAGQDVLIGRLRARVDTSSLALRREDDLQNMLLVLIGVAGPAILNGILADDPAPVRERYANILDILRRGMAKEPAAGALQPKRSN